MKIARRLKSLKVTVLPVTLFATLGCSTFERAQRQSVERLNHLHEQMNADEAAAICAGADGELTKKDDCVETFHAMHRKLGDAGTTVPLSTRISATSSGKYVQTTFDTNFVEDTSATETVTWRESGGAYRLFGYWVNSKALLK